jgi:hypothetical protein
LKGIHGWLVGWLFGCKQELVDRPGRPVCGAEKYIVGEFRKHNNNVGAVAYTAGASAEQQMALDTGMCVYVCVCVCLHMCLLVSLIPFAMI